MLPVPRPPAPPTSPVITRSGVYPRPPVRSQPPTLPGPAAPSVADGGRLTATQLKQTRGLGSCHQADSPEGQGVENLRELTATIIAEFVTETSAASKAPWAELEDVQWIGAPQPARCREAVLCQPMPSRLAALTDMGVPPAPGHRQLTTADVWPASERVTALRPVMELVADLISTAVARDLQASDALRSVSQNSNRKVRDIADELLQRGALGAAQLSATQRSTQAFEARSGC